MEKLILFIVSILFTISLNAQKERAFIREGNKLYNDSLYADALNKYLDASIENPSNNIAKYNIANTLYKNNNYNEAEKIYQELLNTKDIPQENLNYNLGNTYLKKQEFEKAIEQYKKTLRLNPNHKNARYNLSYALAQMKKNQDKDNDNQNDKNNNKEGDNERNEGDGKDDNNQNNENNKKNKKDQNKQENKNEETDKSNASEGQNKNAPKPNELSKDEAEKMLNNLEDNEQQLLQKLIQQQMQKQKYNSDKDW